MVKRHPEAQLVAMCDIQPKEKVGLAELDVPFYNSLEDMLGAGLDIDVVNICSPNGLHAQHSLKALEAGKHIVCGKADGLNQSDAKPLFLKHCKCIKQCSV